MTMLEALIPFAVIGLGIAILYYGYKFVVEMANKQPAEAEEQREPRREDRALTVQRDIAPEELVYLFSHEFCGPPRKPAALRNRHDTVLAPLTGEEVDAQQLANKILYALLTELHRQGFLEFRIVERTPTFMPPFPHKSWELEVRRCGILPPSPLCDCMQIALELMEKRRITKLKAKAGRDDIEPAAEEMFVAFDDLVDRSLRVIRQELTFWEKKGVYGDLGSYVASSLVAAGYLEEVSQDTWLDKIRTRKLKPNRERIEQVAEQARRLAARMADFRRRHGSMEARQEDAADAPVHGNVCPQATGHADPSTLPLDDCLRVSIYEALVCLRQLEPSGGI